MESGQQTGERQLQTDRHRHHRERVDAQPAAEPLQLRVPEILVRWQAGVQLGEHRADEHAGQINSSPAQGGTVIQHHADGHTGQINSSPAQVVRAHSTAQTDTPVRSTAHRHQVVRSHSTADTPVRSTAHRHRWYGHTAPRTHRSDQQLTGTGGTVTQHRGHTGQINSSPCYTFTQQRQGLMCGICG